MKYRLIGTDQVAKVVKVIDAICEARGISVGKAAKEMGLCRASTISNWRAGGGIASPQQLLVRKWINEWKHVLRADAA